MDTTGANEPGQPPAAAAEAVKWTTNLPTPGVAVAVGAHPDDVEFGCGATLAKWAASGCIVHHIVCTDGSKGSWDVDADLKALVARRQDEQRAAAARLGARGEVVFLGQVDGELTSSRELSAELAFHIRRLRPDVVLGHDPWKRYRLHPDHRHAGTLVCDAIVAARDPHFYRDHLRERGVAHHRPDALLLWEADVANHVEDVTGFVETKLTALEAHHSQFESTMRALDDAQLDEFRARVRTRLGDLGRPHGVSAAELFVRISPL